MRKLLIILILLNYVSLSYGDYFNDFKCNQKKVLLRNPDIEFADTQLSLFWYKSNNEKEKIGEVESRYVSYIFWEKKFYGKIYEITGKKNINKILKHFKKEVETIYDGNNYIFKEPIQRKDGSWLFIEPDNIVIVRRYSLNLGRVEILCKNLWAKKNGITNFVTEDLKD